MAGEWSFTIPSPDVGQGIHASLDASFLSEPNPEHIIFFEIGRSLTEYLGTKQCFNLPEQNLANLITELSFEHSQEENTAITATV